MGHVNVRLHLLREVDATRANGLGWGGVGFGCICYVKRMLRVRMWGMLTFGCTCYLLRVHVGLATKPDLCHTGSVVAPPVKSEKVAHMSDAKSRCVVSKMLGNHHFAPAKF